MQISKCKLVSGAQGIGCYVCTSFNRSEVRCEDTFNTSYPEEVINFYQPQCWGARKGREGLFPADHCIKIVGISRKNFFSFYNFFKVLEL